MHIGTGRGIRSCYGFSNWGEDFFFFNRNEQVDGISLIEMFAKTVVLDYFARTIHRCRDGFQVGSSGFDWRLRRVAQREKSLTHGPLQVRSDFASLD